MLSGYIGEIPQWRPIMTTGGIARRNAKDGPSTDAVQDRQQPEYKGDSAESPKWNELGTIEKQDAREQFAFQFIRQQIGDRSKGYAPKKRPCDLVAMLTDDESWADDFEEYCQSEWDHVPDVTVCRLCSDTLIVSHPDNIVGDGLTGPCPRCKPPVASTAIPDTTAITELFDEGYDPTGGDLGHPGDPVNFGDSR